MSRRVVITGLGLVSPLGNSPARLWDALLAGKSGIGELTSVPGDALPTRYGGEAREFTGAIDDFGPLEKTFARNIKKSLKMMCREIQMGVAVAQLAMADASLKLAETDLDRMGVLYGSDYMLTLPQEFSAGIRNCLDDQGKFQFSRWAEAGLPAVEPLWLLKYLPNLPAAHIAIFNDLHGPNNSLTIREASANQAIAEAYCTIERGHADVMIAGATGTRVHPGRTLHVVLQEQIAEDCQDPTTMSRPFDKNRTGQVIGEGAAAIILEESSHAEKRGAKILGEVIGYGSSSVSNIRGIGDLYQTAGNALTQALRTSGLAPDEVGHLNAHGLATMHSDREEARAIRDVFEGRKTPVPVVAAKSYFGNLGAAGGAVELIASVLSLNHGRLFRTLNYETPDPACPIHVVAGDGEPPGDSFINVNLTPQGQGSAIVVRRFSAQA
ncbi:MAG TPA: beta-ketoacyl-[acyl-carrier-protein] synthase family protein [Pirellulaceae bacterium]|nr:beta-ketoacyl-[acyl-carrier-protein] synthase family protein [Pirellulaceae bacterium]